MYLKHLTINGFKSFAKKGELEFSAPITAIVGPNGSGKSNVAEAFRFVLGEQSVKSMRGKRGEDLIFSGTDKISRANRAGVTVTLDNRSKVFPIEYDEITVERVVHRDGQNEYIINGAKVRLKDVQELLAAANIGPTGHHIISQGEADRILSASGRERREMIEDALGLKVYQFKKQEAEKKLKKTEENIREVQLLRKEVAPHLKFLERQVQKINKQIQLKETLKTVYAEYLKREDVYIAYHHDELTRARQEPVSKLEALAEELTVAKETLARTQSEARSGELIAVEEALATARATVQMLLKQSGQLEGQMSFLTAQIKRKTAAAVNVEQAPIPHSAVVELTNGIEQEVQKALQSSDVSYVQRALSAVLHNLRSFLKKTERVALHDTAEEEKQLAEVGKELTALEGQLAGANETETQAQSAFSDLRAKIEADQSESREAEREVFRIVNEQREAENQRARLDQELQALERDRDEFKRELQEAVALIGSAAAQYFTFEVVVDGQSVTPKMMTSEDRSRQRERRRELEKLKIRLEEMGTPSDDVEAEYKTVKERDEFLEREIADLESSVLKLQTLITELAAQLDEQFVVGIEKIGVEFNTFFTLMFGGGDAKLERVRPKVRRAKLDEESGEVAEDETEELGEEGIEINVKLPNKKASGLEILSGGERALTSIALIFAMSQVNPPLFIILDETDAALDEANSRRYGDMIEALGQKSQLILITHNRETMSRAGILYGVTMAGDGASKLLSVKFDEAAVNAK